MKALMIAFSVLAFYNLQAQSASTISEEVNVRGVCDMCKKRIEKAALKIKGVKMATWEAKTQKLTVYYKTSKTDLLKIQETIAAIGHDTESVEAKEEDYKKLPDCCAYRDGVKVH